ncbi:MULTISPECIES: sugar-transfer associated ATP-grasp domain-containing protein [unclassified Lentimonas]|uniref:sugar-transfer associated ATP-grasp domain-containing protein n=1 Tax=unclassified Lentimonas TaxID=2630993 RepID=UPI001324CDEC|nr:MULTISPECIES: sugar-transfer associated ATP-grasp domain-containing protein [unclassified Lentimonas]CAA6678611.1 Unannotated [Lentimonas sp. CC4]CAA6685843.1 Unannotated [Lentimonas sp. CC6]CAA7076317.1 Unannotated [Lentimonas sp. CC4]CAA7171864.1 Unannotated [Lentimonas sp. CC21]CAA7181571.1 Unannotated [Lentimonas sp. CC8]
MKIRGLLQRLAGCNNTLIVCWFPWYWCGSETARLRKLVSHLEWTSCGRFSTKVYFICKALLWPAIAACALVLVWRRYAKEAVPINDRSMIRQLIELCQFTFWYGASPNEYYERRMYEQHLPSVMRDFISQHECQILASALNGIGVEGIKNKQQFESICVAAGLPVVPVLYYLDSTRGTELPNHLELPHANLFLKPVYGKKGIGIQRWDFDAYSHSWSFNGRVLPEDSLRAYMIQLAKTDAYILQQAVSNHSSVACFSLSGVVTFRVVTVCDGLSDAEVVAAYLAAPRGHTVTNHENYGGMMAELDISTQRFDAAYSETPYMERHRNHPDTGAQIEGAKLPSWPGMAALAVSAHALFPDVVSVGWDIVYTPEGFRLLEGNTFWGMSPGLFLGRTEYVRVCFELWERKQSSSTASPL